MNQKKDSRVPLRQPGCPKREMEQIDQREMLGSVAFRPPITRSLALSVYTVQD
jgi:hypothetical protein